MPPRLTLHTIFEAHAFAWQGANVLASNTLRILSFNHVIGKAPCVLHKMHITSSSLQL